MEKNPIIYAEIDYPSKGVTRNVLLILDDRDYSLFKISEIYNDICDFVSRPYPNCIINSIVEFSAEDIINRSEWEPK